MPESFRVQLKWLEQRRRVFRSRPIVDNAEYFDPNQLLTTPKTTRMSVDSLSFSLLFDYLNH
jgi:hypothetical protein